MLLVRLITARTGFISPFLRRLHIRELLNESVPLLLRLAMTGNGSNPKITGNALDIQDFDIVFVEPQCGIGGESQAVSVGSR